MQYSVEHLASEREAELFQVAVAAALAVRDEQWADVLQVGFDAVVGAMQTPRRIEFERNRAGAITGATS